MRRLMIIALILAIPLSFTGCITSRSTHACKKDGACKKEGACTCKKHESKPACSCPDKASCTCKK